MSYRNTLQADALKLVAKKMQSSLAVEGELPEDGLAAYGDDGDDMMMALARKIVSGDEEDEAETMEDYSVYTMRQASRRSWRIGQTRARQGRVHGLPGHPPGRCIEAGGPEAAKLPGGGG